MAEYAPKKVRKYYRSWLLFVAVVLNSCLVLLQFNSLHLAVWPGEYESVARSEPVTASIPLSFNGTGVVLFYHVAKTGGTTVRSFFKASHGVNCVRVKAWERFESLVPRIDSIIGGERNELLFLELHGENLPGLSAFHGHIQRWKKLSAEKGVPFFASTFIREPVSFYISFFLYFHLPDCTMRWCEPKTYKPTEENLIASALANRQCWMFFHGQMRKMEYADVEAKDCETVKELLKSDWAVYTTESMNTVALPFLAQLILNDPSAVERAKRQKKRNVSHKMPSLTASTIDKATETKLRALSSLDKDLYDSYVF